MESQLLGQLAGDTLTKRTRIGEKPYWKSLLIPIPMKSRLLGQLVGYILLEPLLNPTETYRNPILNPKKEQTYGLY